MLSNTLEKRSSITESVVCTVPTKKGKLRVLKKGEFLHSFFLIHFFFLRKTANTNSIRLFPCPFPHSEKKKAANYSGIFLFYFFLSFLSFPLFFIRASIMCEAETQVVGSFLLHQSVYHYAYEAS